MALNTFLHCCLPYYFQKHERGFWYPVNRESAFLGSSERREWLERDLPFTVARFTIKKKTAQVLSCHKGVEFEEYWKKDLVYLYKGSMSGLETKIYLQKLASLFKFKNRESNRFLELYELSTKLW